MSPVDSVLFWGILLWPIGGRKSLAATDLKKCFILNILSVSLYWFISWLLSEHLVIKSVQTHHPQWAGLTLILSNHWLVLLLVCVPTWRLCSCRTWMTSDLNWWDILERARDTEAGAAQPVCSRSIRKLIKVIGVIYRLKPRHRLQTDWKVFHHNVKHLDQVVHHVLWPQGAIASIYLHEHLEDKQEQSEYDGSQNLVKHLWWGSAAVHGVFHNIFNYLVENLIIYWHYGTFNLLKGDLQICISWNIYSFNFVTFKPP